MLAGFVSGLAGALLFAAAHAVLIVPIWNRMASGLVFGVLAGGAAGWALAEICPEHGLSSAKEAAAIGVRFGAMLWLLVVPVTAADAVLRVLRIAPHYELVAVGVALVLAVGGGAVFAWRRTHHLRGTIAGAAATLALTVAMAGPVPVGRSPRAFAIFIAVLPAATLACGVLAVLSRLIHDMRARRKLTPVAPRS